MEVSSKDVQNARRSAIKAKTAMSCVSCLAYGHRCSQLRPCTSCVKQSKLCRPALFPPTCSYFEGETAALSYYGVEGKPEIELLTSQPSYSPSLPARGSILWYQGYDSPASIVHKRFETMAGNVAMDSDTAPQNPSGIRGLMLFANVDESMTMTRAENQSTAERISVPRLVHDQQEQVCKM